MKRSSTSRLKVRCDATLFCRRLLGVRRLLSLQVQCGIVQMLDHCAGASEDRSRDMELSAAPVLQETNIDRRHAPVGLPQVNKVAVLATAVRQLRVVVLQVLEFVVQAHLNDEGWLDATAAELLDRVSGDLLGVEYHKVEVSSPALLSRPCSRLGPLLMYQSRVPSSRVATEGIHALQRTVNGQHRVKLAVNGVLAPMDIGFTGKVVNEAVDGRLKDVLNRRD